MKTRNNVTLEDITLNITDGTHSTVKNDLCGTGFLLSCKNIKNNRVNISNTDRRISKEQLDKLKKRTKLDKDDVLITTVGTIGEMAMIEDENPNYDFQRSVGILKPNKEFVVPKYLFYALQGEKSQIFSRIKGAVQQCLFLGDIKQISIDLPTMEEQNKIVSVLDFIEKKIRNNEDINKNLAA